MAANTPDLSAPLLERLAQNPEHWFTRSELEQLCRCGFDDLRASGLLADLQRVGPGGYVQLDCGRTMRVTVIGSGHMGVDECDPDALAVRLSVHDLTRCRVDLLAVARRLASQCGVEPQPELVTPRVLYLGAREGPAGSAAVALLLAANPEMAENLIAQLRMRIRAHFVDVVAICPGLHDLPETMRKRLEEEGVCVVPEPPDDVERVLEAARALADESEARAAKRLIVEVSDCRAILDGVMVELTYTEAIVLAAIATHPGQAVTHEAIARAADPKAPHDWIPQVKKRVSSIRRKLEEAAHHGEGKPQRDTAEMIQTVRGSGYRLCLPERDVLVKREKGGTKTVP